MFAHMSRHGLVDEALLDRVHHHAAEFLRALPERHVGARATRDELLAALRAPLGDGGEDPAKVIDLLAAQGDRGAIACAGPRYFGFVIGGTLPAALAADWLTSTWDQNVAMFATSPAAAEVEAIVAGWVLDLLGLPASAGVGLVTGCQMANFTGLAAARQALLARVGWDVEEAGLAAGPPLRVLVGEEGHATIYTALRLLGIGRRQVQVVAADAQGRMRADALAAALARGGGPTLVCAQAGNVNSGAVDPLADIAALARAHQAWLHVDGAFGLWALAAPTRAHLVRGLDRADSWATDGHKWLNVTYDCGIALVRRPGDLRRTFAAGAGYLPPADAFEPMHHTPQSSQRARQVEVWAVLRALGRRGVADLVTRACEAATALADRLRAAPGMAVLNDVVLNQVLVRLHDGPTTERLVAAVQADGRIWCGPTSWDGATAMRISVSSWKTTVTDARAAADVILACAATVTDR
jgi:glutamate/tyrosine decarboxylase-like PLP-dependent enzyme